MLSKCKEKAAVDGNLIGNFLHWAVEIDNLSSLEKLIKTGK